MIRNVVIKATLPSSPMCNCSYGVFASLVSQSRRALTSPGMDFLVNPTPEHRSLRETVHKFAAGEVARRARYNDREHHFDRELFQQAADLGLLGLTVPEEHGGAGMDTVGSVIVHHELSRYDPGFCLAYLAHSLLFVNNFYYAANEAQRKKYIGKVCSGEWIGAMGMSEPNAGTDVLGMRSTATKDASTGDFLLNGGKIWITNGPVADVFLIYAKVDGKVTAFVVEKSFAGFTTGPKIDKCGMKASLMCELRFDQVRVPAENLLGEVGMGSVHMMRNLEIERVCAAAMGLGIAEQCVNEMIQYANQRSAFGKKISEFGQIQKYIAESFAEVEATRALTYAVARSVAPGTQNRIGTDAAKLFAALVSKRVADNAMQVMGAMGYICDSPIERLWRDAKLLEIGGGTLEAHHKNLTKDLSRLIK